MNNNKCKTCGLGGTTIKEGYCDECRKKTNPNTLPNNIDSDDNITIN